MKYHQFSKKGQEDRSHLLADIFGSILREDACTSVVTPLLTMITKITGREMKIASQVVFSEPNTLVISSDSAFCNTYCS